ncbi:hypothetical protein [Curtobacterium sp. MCBA15_005]|uniref:hypothetical protein n=1 Tax=Curtobacterium sp. MCBA15_005 TaxID=1898734 RepID=UPI0015876192|nr:hypothetical protein [Curtobacterium sp. MCBA15_005]
MARAIATRCAGSNALRAPRTLEIVERRGHPRTLTRPEVIAFRGDDTSASVEHPDQDRQQHGQQEQARDCRDLSLRHVVPLTQQQVR